MRDAILRQRAAEALGVRVAKSGEVDPRLEEYLRRRLRYDHMS
jgi:hypothetical protein